MLGSLVSTVGGSSISALGVRRLRARAEWVRLRPSLASSAPRHSTTKYRNLDHSAAQLSPSVAQATVRPACQALWCSVRCFSIWSKFSIFPSEDPRSAAAQPSKPSADNSASRQPTDTYRGPGNSSLRENIYHSDPIINAKVAHLRRLEEETRRYGAPKWQVPFIVMGGMFALGMGLSGWLLFWGILPLVRRTRVFGALPPLSPSPISQDGTLNTQCAACGVSVWQSDSQVPMEGSVGLPSKTGAEPAVLFMGRLWHRRCLKCSVCQRRLAMKRSQILGREFASWLGNNETVQALMVDMRPCCAQCYLQTSAPSCCICGSNPLSPVGRSAVPSRMVVGRMGEVYCSRHVEFSAEFSNEKRNRVTQYCHSCQYPVHPRSTGGGIRYGDGRIICKPCRSQAIIGTQNLQILSREVVDDLERATALDFGDLIIPVRAVERGGFSSLSSLISWLRAWGTGALIDLRWRTTEGMTRRREMAHLGRVIDEIMILDGLPYLHAAKVLAHEHAHAFLWLQAGKEHGQSRWRVTPEVEEGLCELISYFWLCHQLNQVESMTTGFWKALGWTDRERRTKELYMHLMEMEQSRDPIYGVNFRLAYDTFLRSQMTLKEFLAYVERTGDFPHVPGSRVIQ